MSADGSPPPPPPPPPPPRHRGPSGPSGQGGPGSGGAGGGGPLGSGGSGSGVPSPLGGRARWAVWLVALAAVLLLVFVFIQGRPETKPYSYTAFLSQVSAGHVHEVTYDNKTGKITGKLDDKTEFHTTG